MKRVMLLLGGAGCAVAQAVVYAACAGAWSGETDLLLVDNGAAAPARQKTAALVEQYERLRTRMETIPGERLGFTAPLHLHTWPDTLPASTLEQWATTEDDRLLCRALFSQKVAEKKLTGNLSGCDAAAKAVFSALLSKTPPEVEPSADTRLLLVGSLSDGWGAAGVDAFTRFYQASGASMASLLLMPYAGQDEHAQHRAEDALRGMAHSESVYVLGVSESDCVSADSSAGHLVEWLAACCADSFFRAQDVPKGLMTYRVAAGRLGWESFPGAYRVCFGSLMKTAAAFHLTLEPVIRRGLTAPRWLRDKFIGWYVAYFRQAANLDEGQRTALLEELDGAKALLDGALAWMSELLKGMPPLLRASSAMEQARREAAENYRQYIETAGLLKAMKQEAAQNGLLEDHTVHRHDTDNQEIERMERVFQQLEEKQNTLAQQQETLNRRIGGAAQLLMMKGVLAELNDRSSELHAQRDEAQSRIDQAALVASSDEQHRIATARTKLQRMERYIAQVDACMAIVASERSNAKASGVKRVPPELAEANMLPENQLFSAAALEKLLHLPDREAKNARRAWFEAEADFPGLVLPLRGDEASLSELVTQLKDGEAGDAPVAALLRDTMLMMAREVR